MASGVDQCARRHESSETGANDDDIGVWFSTLGHVRERRRSARLRAAWMPVDNASPHPRRNARRQSGRMAPAALDDGQVVTLLVGLGLELLQLHQEGRAYGPVHPAHVRVDDGGRPHLAGVQPPPGWTAHDDWVALLRLGRHLGASAKAQRLSWETAGRREDVDLLRWLLDWSPPSALARGIRNGADRHRIHGPVRARSSIVMRFRRTGGHL